MVTDQEMEPAGQGEGTAVRGFSQCLQVGKAESEEWSPDSWTCEQTLRLRPAPTMRVLPVLSSGSLDL